MRQNYREMIVHCKFMPKDRIKEMLINFKDILEIVGSRGILELPRRDQLSLSQNERDLTLLQIAQ